VRTVFLGTSEFAAAVLERLVDQHVGSQGTERAPHRPTLVLTRPDRPAGRGRKLLSPPVADAARRLGIELAQPESVNDAATRELIARAEAEIVVVCAFGALIKEPLLSNYEMLNVHPSLLPRWRGAAPIERSIMAGDTETGVSIMRLTAGLDSGPVCLATSEPIAPTDTYGSLAPRLSSMGAELLVRALDAIQRGESLPFAEQQEDLASYAEKISAQDRLLDPARPAVELERLVRALHPHVGARVALDDATMLGVQRARVLKDSSVGGNVGERETAPTLERDADPHATRAHGLFTDDDRLLLACNPGTLELLLVQPAGKRPMEAAAFLRGHGLPGGH
jgi:methionyl-tRNA formyltransferase